MIKYSFVLISLRFFNLICINFFDDYIILVFKTHKEFALKFSNLYLSVNILMQEKFFMHLHYVSTILIIH